ncbi:MAG: hypothetical protein NVSMB39_1070 [Candidatus Saccharimonadales bacterium]
MVKFLKAQYRNMMAALVAIIAIVGLSACSGSTSSSQSKSQQVTEDYQAAAEAAVPYPLDEVKKGGFLERKLLRENLLRQNNSNRLAYVILLNQQGQPIVQYPIRGMVFDLNSQMTTQDRINGCVSSSSCGGVVTRAPGDNGTWGDEPHAIGFFTTEGVEIKYNGLYIESDSPQDITTKPLIVYNADAAKPSVSSGGVPTK